MKTIEELERRIEELEHRTRSLPWVMLFLVLGMIGAVWIQCKMDYHFAKQISAIRAVESAEANHAK